MKLVSGVFLISKYKETKEASTYSVCLSFFHVVNPNSLSIRKQYSEPVKILYGLPQIWLSHIVTEMIEGCENDQVPRRTYLACYQTNKFSNLKACSVITLEYNIKQCYWLRFLSLRRNVTYLGSPKLGRLYRYVKSLPTFCFPHIFSSTSSSTYSAISLYHTKFALSNGAKSFIYYIEK